jgi:hypothetical protein
VVGQPRHLVDIVGHVEDRQRGLTVQALEPGEDLLPAGCVEPGHRFIQQQHGGLDQQRAGDGRTPTLAARERGGSSVEQGAQPEQFDDFVAVAGGGRNARAALAVGEVATHVEVREQVGVLEDEADPAPVGRQPHAARGVLPDLAVDRHGSGHARLKAGDGSQQRCLARARRAEQRRDAAPGQGEIDVERESRPFAAQAHGDVADFHHAGRRRRCSP